MDLRLDWHFVSKAFVPDCRFVPCIQDLFRLGGFFASSESSSNREGSDQKVFIT